MKKISGILLLVIALLFNGCESDQSAEVRKVTGFSSICIDGVTYIKYVGYKGYKGYFGITVMLDKNSKIIPCTNTKID